MPGHEAVCRVSVLTPDMQACPEPPPAGVQVYLIVYAAWRPALDACEAVLTTEERAHAAGFHFPRGRESFVLRRGLRCRLLSRRVPCPPCDVSFVYGPYGKPGLADPASPVRFSVSHARGMAGTMSV